MNVTRASSSDRRRARHTVLVGGPGQGKSTVTQWLSQLYRCEFLRHAPIADNPEIGQLIENLDARASVLGMPSIAAKRWPFRIVLTEFADFIAANPDSSLMSFIANRVSAGGAVEVDQEDMARWLETFPWALFIDGLDEVPKSSNRDQVVTAIRHFFFEADNVGGDVVAVATTRPQGYSNEFAAEAYEHVQLQSLDTETALSCAQALLDVRFGGALSMVEKVMMRLEKAAGDSSTARLFASPLQVTILTVLLEKLGKPPGDRWRLFSAYYKVISDREQEKSGELSELLQRFDSDIDAIHRTVGYLLQQRSSEAGETSASLTKQEFEQVVRRQFEAQGHGAAEVDALLDDFTRLVTDRLVFLTYESSDRLGFELRSLQEFMAAEFVVNFPEAEVPDLLRSLAQSSHWRNVLLFAIGGIFAQRAPLRAEVTLLCAELNRADSSADVLLVGSDLAVGVLSDGSCLSMPKYARQLAATAAEVVERGMWRRIFELTELRDSYTLDAVKNVSADLSPGVGAKWLGRAIALSRLAQRHSDLSGDLARLISAVPAEFAPLLVLHSLQQDDTALAHAVEGLLHHCDPTQLMNGRPLDRFAREGDGEADTRPIWVNQLRSICAPPANEAGSGVGLGLIFRYHPLRSSPDAWEWLANFSRGLNRWAAVRAVSEFASEPTRDSLGRTLEALADLPRIHVFRGMPWVLSACIRWVDDVLQGDAHAPSAKWEEGFLSLAAAARAGELGDEADWLRAEEKSPSGSALTAELVRGWSSLPTGPGFPLSPASVALGVPPWGSAFELRSVSSDEGKSLGHLVDEIIKLPAVVAGGRRHPAGGVLEFVIGHFLASRAVVAQPEVALAQWEWLEMSFAAEHQLHARWAPWIASLRNDFAVDRAKLLKGLTQANIWLRAEDESGDVRDYLLSERASGLEQWRTLRLAAQVDPHVLRQRAPIWPDPIPENDFARSLLHAHRVAAAVQQSHFDEDAMVSAEILAGGLGGPFDMNWLVNLVQNGDTRLICDLVRRIGANFPIAAERLDMIARAKAVAGSPEPIVGL